MNNTILIHSNNGHVHIANNPNDQAIVILNIDK